jgi:hypothetical protein
MYAYWYVKKILGERWPEAERYIKKDLHWAYFYSRDIIKGR